MGESHPPIVPNGMIKNVWLLNRRHWLTWITVWPFIFLYIAQTVVFQNPSLVWGRITYIVHGSNIDFFHAVCYPLLFFFHGFLALMTVWSVRLKALILFSKVNMAELQGATSHLPATHIFVETHEHKGESGIEKLEIDAQKNIFFHCQQRKWSYSREKKMFVKPRFPTHHAFDLYYNWKGLETESDILRQGEAFGHNIMTLDVPSFGELLADHALGPFFVFQMFCVLLWCLDEYWMYSLFTGVMLVVMECAVVYQRVRNTKTLREMSEVPVSKLHVMRKGRTVEILTTELLPMDLLIVPTNTPCPVDAILIQGSCVVNESTLTGESTPQLKEAIDELTDMTLSTKKHARHLLFAGTRLMLSSGPVELPGQGPKAALAVVIKTGFETKQGKLLRTIIHSQGRVSENNGEAFGFIGALLVFAIAASGYLLRRGLADPSRSRWKLFLNCTQIITAVVPPELPMELSLAVNNSLMQLVKLKVFCTEPFRIPSAGKVDTCCFDKTGTLTTDEMLFTGVVCCDGEGIRRSLKKIPAKAEFVLATCNALIHLDETGAAGDAMEKAACDTLGYTITQDGRVLYEPQPDANISPMKPSAASNDTSGKHASAASTKPKRRVPNDKDYTILCRFPFLPALRRMSCIVRTPSGGKHVVVKGSPDAIKPLCTDVPASYTALAEEHASNGYRVIALAHRALTSAEKELVSDMKREDCDKDLSFAGFALFECPLKRDVVETIANLQGGSHRCVIITGDGVQTAIAVGREVKMCPCETQLIVRAQGTKESGIVLDWLQARNGAVQPSTAQHIIAGTFARSRRHTSPFSHEWDLCVNAEILTPALFDAVVEQFAPHVAIWARCAPLQKEAIITRLKSLGHTVLMAGDGTNDVGALKQAHVGIAVLNSASIAPAAASEASAANGEPPVSFSPTTHNEPDIPQDCLLPPGCRLPPIPPPLNPDAPFMANMRHQMAMAQRKAMVIQIKKWNVAYQKAKQERDAKKLKELEQNAKDGNRPQEASEQLMKSLFNSDGDEMEMAGGVPIIKLGDASIAAPFTCRSKAMMSICDIVRMGRSTLVTTLQMYKILALNCLTSAYTMSVLHCDGVKLGDRQMMVAGMIMSVCFICMSRSQPLERLSVQRPITRVFHPYMVITILGQFALHLYSMMVSSRLVLEVDYESTIAQSKEAEDADFRPTLLNTIMFLLSTLQSATTFAVNFRGEPFMQSIRKNRPMFFSLCALFGLVFYLASEVNPEVNELLEIVPFPSDTFRQTFLRILLVDTVGAFLIENVCLRLMTDA